MTKLVRTLLAFAWVWAIGGICTLTQVGAAPWQTERGQVRFLPTVSESGIEARYRLEPHAFDYELRHLPKVGVSITISDLTFPSAVVTETAVNNTVHCEYYRPRGEGPYPAVVVLHILGGDFALSRVFANSLAQHGVAALFLKMPYYGPRRAANSRRRMISANPRETVAGMTQAVLDIRRATAWLQQRREVDKEKLGVFGISLGGITAALAATAEPRLQNVCLVLAGGEVGEVTWASRETRKLRERWVAQGGTKQELLKWLRLVDPVTYADRVRNGGRRILMLNATDDEVVPKRCTLALWEAFGQPPIEWYSGGHYSVARHLVSMLTRVPRFFTSTSAKPAFPGKRSQWQGFDRYDYQVDGQPVLVVAPAKPAAGNPWVWHGEFFGHKPAPDIELLKRGCHVVYMRAPNLLGAPVAVQHWNALYQDLTQRGLGPRPALVGLSRGGLYCYNWAIANPSKVACIYGDAPVCDFKSWPGGQPLARRTRNKGNKSNESASRWRGKGSPRDWQLVLETYKFPNEAAALAYRGNPVDSLQSLAEAGVPLLHVFGDADAVVPWKENTGLLAKRYQQLGGTIQLIRKPGVGHHPHGLDDPTPIVEFILKHTHPGRLND